jgi:hypothetical protein
MVWFRVDIPLIAGLLLMAALMDLRVFKLGLLVASILLMFSAGGVIVFGTKLGIIPANAVAVLSVMVWLACVVPMIRRRFPLSALTSGLAAGLIVQKRVRWH